ncbi:MAG: cell filamentation protein Fic [Aquificaceae bacterium]|nr:MAG: cell filamentation protein Fic [Aquificaceae bacterium]
MQDKYWQMPPNKNKALMLAQRQLSEFVYDAVNLEGINMTLPEIQTLLEGITVGGHKISDQQIALNQANAWRQLFAWIKADDFQPSQQISCKLHAIAAKEEALEWGRFRSGGVLISGTDYMPPKSSLLPECFNQMLEDMKSLDDVYDRAIHLFLTMARTQFFYDVNKRMGRFIMNGYLLSYGYPAINLPAKSQQTFNQLMLDFYKSNNQSDMNKFMRSCMDERVVQIMLES